MEKEYLGLGLSLSCYSSNGSSSHLSLLHSSPPSQPPSSSCQQKPSQWHNLLPHSESRPWLLLTRTDVNRAPSAAAGRNGAEDRRASSPNSTISNTSAKRTERAGSGGISDEEDGGDGCRKKLRLSKDQSAVLEDSFKEHSTLNLKQKLALAKQLNLRPRQVEVWFQNRRARTKLKQTEVDCELLRRCCQELTQENRRLQKEVLELRALKLSPQLYMHMTPPTTLILCPSCERVSTTQTSSSRNQPAPEHRKFLHHQRLDAPPQHS